MVSPTPTPCPLAECPTCLAFTPTLDGPVLLACGDDRGDVHVWDIATGAPVAPVMHDDEREAVASLAWGPALAPSTAPLLAVARGRTVTLWDSIAVTGSDSAPVLRHTFAGHSRSVTDVAMAAVPGTGTAVLATVSKDCTARVWDAGTGATVVGPLSGHAAPLTCTTLVPVPALDRLVLVTADTAGP